MRNIQAFTIPWGSYFSLGESLEGLYGSPRITRCFQVSVMAPVSGPLAMQILRLSGRAESSQPTVKAAGPGLENGPIRRNGV